MCAAVNCDLCVFVAVSVKLGDFPPSPDSFDLCVFVAVGANRERFVLPTVLIFVCLLLLVRIERAVCAADSFVRIERFVLPTVLIFVCLSLLV